MVADALSLGGFGSGLHGMSSQSGGDVRSYADAPRYPGAAAPRSITGERAAPGYAGLVGLIAPPGIHVRARTPSDRRLWRGDPVRAIGTASACTAGRHLLPSTRRSIRSLLRNRPDRFCSGGVGRPVGAAPDQAKSRFGLGEVPVQSSSWLSSMGPVEGANCLVQAPRGRWPAVRWRRRSTAAGCFVPCVWNVHRQAVSSSFQALSQRVCK